MHKKFGLEYLKGDDHSEDVRVAGDNIKMGKKGNTVSIVTDYRLDDRGSIADRDREFFF
jgi:hypothetical protein